MDKMGQNGQNLKMDKNREKMDVNKRPCGTELPE